MELNETGLSALANFADAAVSSPTELESLAEAAIDDARRFDSAGNSSALALALAVIASTLDSIEAAPEARTLGTLVTAARQLQAQDEGLAREAGRALDWALENQQLVQVQRRADSIPSGLHSRSHAARERSRPNALAGAGQGPAQRHKY